MKLQIQIIQTQLSKAVNCLIYCNHKLFQRRHAVNLLKNISVNRGINKTKQNKAKMEQIIKTLFDFIYKCSWFKLCLKFSDATIHNNKIKFKQFLVHLFGVGKTFYSQKSPPVNKILFFLFLKNRCVQI